MNTFALDGSFIHIPACGQVWASFRQWFYSEKFPEIGRICYLNGEVWADMSKELAFSHIHVKSEYNIVLGSIAKTSRRGRYYPDGTLLTHLERDLACQPDGIYVSYESLEAGRIRLVEGAREGYFEFEGSPDIILEVVSTSSVEKDTVMQLDLYWRAGIREYWLVDARGERLEFDIWRHTPTGYVPARKQRGCAKSAVFGKSFRLTRQDDEHSDPEYTLAVR